MKKKIAVILASVILSMCLVQSVSAINVIMNSAFVTFPDQEPVIENGVTLVPVRAIAEMLGLTVTWDDATDTVTLKKDNFFAELVIGSTSAKTSAGKKTLDVAPKIINKRTMVPLRFIAEAMGLKVYWNDEYKRVVINGKVDTLTEYIVPEDDVTDATMSEDATGVVEDGTSEESSEAATEEEFVEEFECIMAETGSAAIRIDMPLTYVMEDTGDEGSFAARAIDGLDAQHKYNWDIVTQYESYADEALGSGIVLILQENAPYEGEEIEDISRITEAYPEAPMRPEFPQIDWGYIQQEATRIIIEQICAEKEIEVPGGWEEMEDEERAIALGFGSAEELTAYMEGVDMQEIMLEIPEYNDMLIYQEEMEIYREDKAIYDEEVREHNKVRVYVLSNLDKVYSQLSDEEWAEFFASYLNSDEEVRYEDVEMVPFGGKKAVHATIYAEDPDDEQGVFEYYYFIDGNSVVTIYGGSLYESEVNEEVLKVLEGMYVG